MAKARHFDLVLVYLAAAIVFVSLITIFGTEAIVVSQEKETTGRPPSHPRQQHDVRLIHERELTDKLEIVELEHEKLFQKSIKSCIPVKNSKECKEFIPKPLQEGHERTQRVGVLAPPGDITLSLQNRIEHIVRQHNERTAQDETPIELVVTTHVPPYGYGRSHGYTKLVRVAPQPLLLQVTDALTASLKPGETHGIVQEKDVVAATRMILRWHCRMSHIAAHTALYSVPLLDFIQDGGEVVKKMEDFLSPNLRTSMQTHRVEKVGDDDATLNVDDDESGMMDAEFAYGNQILRDLGVPNIIKLLDEVLTEEVKATKGFSKWPCPSFWSHPEELSPLGKRMAKALSPNCDDPYAQCFVERDKCEFRGDAECKKKK